MTDIASVAQEPTSVSVPEPPEEDAASTYLQEMRFSAIVNMFRLQLWHRFELRCALQSQSAGSHGCHELSFLGTSAKSAAGLAASFSWQTVAGVKEHRFRLIDHAKELSNICIPMQSAQLDGPAGQIDSNIAFSLAEISEPHLLTLYAIPDRMRAATEVAMDAPAGSFLKKIEAVTELPIISKSYEIRFSDGGFVRITMDQPQCEQIVPGAWLHCDERGHLRAVQNAHVN